MQKHYWNEYQKEIAADRYFYARSCIRQTFFPGSETAFLKILQDELGKDIYDSADQHTCSGIGYHGDVVPFLTTSTVIARLFSLMTEAGYKNYVPSCITSFGLIVEVLDTWKHFPETLEQTRESLLKATGRTFEIPENVAHPSDIIYKFRNELKSKMKYQLIEKSTGRPLRGVEHIGCHYAKVFPDKGVGGAEFPHVLAGMIESWGGEVVDYPERRHCCGFGFRNYLVQANRGYSVSNSHKKFESMAPYKPDFIIANCPGCAMFLDKWQYTIAEMEGKTYDEQGRGIPVFTYEELAGLLLGYDPWKLGVQIHQVQAESFLDKIGIEYNPDEKYKGASGEELEHPQKPSVLKV
ncbi:heterodisulfide reductase subunit B [Bacteroidales bacterium OttesenSCG-928-B11]|nr:heterodisulfide reductase subunit B [Bacteroidales bacterium OttesenSCG-928-C03]MDL2311599.1 heterodisulfide reductase subunit B [Bacteroidales bacterium OttesenSCG-928-B11]MDL2326716.1 heterodisulfide reductase subunit B [Bacteroidales bacterium OttesenSCG-928-A14]